VSLIGQTLAAGDWRYDRVYLPTNSPITWNVTFAQALGDVVMYVRDIVPPGQGGYTTDYRHWAAHVTRTQPGELVMATASMTQAATGSARLQRGTWLNRLRFISKSHAV
jgi:hypothetical protein